MANHIRQFILKRFNAGAVFSALYILLLPSLVLAAPTITSVTVNTVNPAPGGSLSVTVIYCETASWTNDFFDVALESSGNTTLQPCPQPGQHLLVDGGTSPVGPVSPATSARNDASDPGQGWNAGNSAAAPTCPATQIFNVTIPVTMAIGSYNIVAAAGPYDIQCNNSDSNLTGQSHVVGGININFSSEAPSLTITKASIGDAAAANNLVLWQINYNAINDTPITISDTVPANTVLAGSSPFLASISPGGTPTGTGAAGTPITWVVDTSSAPTGQVWFLTTVDAGFLSGSLTNQATASSTLGTITSNILSVPVGGDFQLTKQILNTVLPLASGSSVTYALNYIIGQDSLQVFDSYNNDTAPTTTTNGSNVTGYDSPAADSVYTSSGTEDQWEIQNDPAVGAPGNGNYIDVEADPGNTNNTAGYESLLRASPYVGTCGGGTWVIEGDLNMPSTLQNGSGLGGGGQNATLAILDNPGNSYGFNVILNHDYPGITEMQLQEYNVGAGTGPGSENFAPVAGLSGGTFHSAAMNADAPGGIVQYNTWYTIKAQVTYNSGPGTYTIDVWAWPVGTPDPSAGPPDITFTTGANGTASYLPCANYQFGWVADPSSNSSGNWSSGRELYTDLSLVSAIPVVNPVITDTLPAGETYSGVVGSSQLPTSTGPPLVWDIGTQPVTVYDLSGAITYTALVNCVPPQQINDAEIAGTVSGTVQTLLSNAVTLNVNGCSTPTNTATNSATNTVTNTATNTNTQTPTNTPTYTSTATTTNTATNTSTATPTNTPTDTPTDTSTNTPLITNTFTNTPTVTVTNTATNTPTLTDTVTATNTPTDTDTIAPTNTATNTATTTDTNTPTDTATNTVPASATNTATLTSTSTATNTATLTNTVTSSNTPTQTATSTPTSAPTITIQKKASASAVNPGSNLVYDVFLSVSGAPATNVTVQDTLPANETFMNFETPTPAVAVTPSQSGQALSWSFNTLPVGNYQLPYQVSVSNQASSSTPLVNQAWVNYSGGAPITASCSVTVLGLYTVQIDIYNSAGEVVKTIPVQSVSQPINAITLSTSNQITTLQGPGSVILIYYNGILIGNWDGSNNSGNPVTNGNYVIKVDSTSNSGIVTSVQEQAIVNRQLSNVTATIYNSAGEVVRTLYNVVSDALNSQMTNVNLSSSVLTVGPNASGSASTLQIFVDTSGAPVTLTWDGTNNSATAVTPGSYTIQLNWDNGQGQTTVIGRTVLVISGGGAIGVVLAEPNMLGTGQMTTTFNGTGIANATALNVKIYTIAGQMVPTTVSQTPGIAIAQWNATGMASGLYIAVVEVQNANGGVIQTQTLKILVLH